MYIFASVCAFHAKSSTDLISFAKSTGVPADVTDGVLQEARHWFNLPACVLDFFDICIHLKSPFANDCILPINHLALKLQERKYGYIGRSMLVAAG